MALIATVEYYPHAGAVWQRYVAIAAAAANTAANTLTTTIGAVNNCRSIRTSVDDGTDVTQIDMVDQMQTTGQTCPIEFAASLPGIRAAPTIFPQFAGARNCLSFWVTNARATRVAWIQAITGGTVATATVIDFNAGTPAQRTAGAVYTWTRTQHFLVDMVIGSSEFTTPIPGLPGSEALANGQPANAQMAVVGGASGGSAPDLTGVIAALNDIALIDVDYTANNGGAVWSMRGKVRDT